ncbi:STM4014 family protein [Nocardia sp. NEAU-351]|uniref:STM4014 family protein n=2 Tax=Nocardia bovistercoris TaxID=2785916 RepID=A0A931N2Z7_9NOCA|nr:STM4014 family protein [Nocardia bovistercoris]
MFTEAARAAGVTHIRLLEWRDVLHGRGCEFDDDEIVRLDSPGENNEVDRLLRDAPEPTRVEGSGRWYRRFLAAVRTLRGGFRLDDTEDLAALFDKRRSHARLAKAGVPVPHSPTSEGQPPVRGWVDVRERLREMPRVFVKPAHGSSASGVLALESTRGGRLRATTSVEIAPDGALHNSLRVRRYTGEREIAAVIDRLAPDGLHLEQWIPKVSQAGRSADLRVVVIGGRATHVVVRTSRAPLTNLHLGGARGDLEVFRAAVGERWSRALSICEEAAACFPSTLCVGVDLLPAVGWRHFFVGEVNAFGDLLPRLTGLPEGPAAGLDTYTAQVIAATSRYHNARQSFSRDLVGALRGAPL